VYFLIKGWEEKIRKDHIKALDKGDLVLIIFGSTLAAAMNSIQMINMGTGLPFSLF
jgi:hypothetical protein